MEGFQIGDPVKHRTWKYKGVVTDVPFDQTRLSDVTVKWHHQEQETDAWIPAIMLDEEELEYDWSELVD